MRSAWLARLQISRASVRAAPGFSATAVRGTGVSNSLDWDRDEHFDVVGERNLGKSRIKCDPRNALDGLPYRARIITSIHVVLDERPHHAHGKARLRHTRGVALGRDRIEIAQPALEHVQWVQHIHCDAVGQGDFRGTLADDFSVEADDP